MSATMCIHMIGGRYEKSETLKSGIFEDAEAWFYFFYSKLATFRGLKQEILIFGLFEVLRKL